MHALTPYLSLARRARQVLLVLHANGTLHGFSRCKPGLNFVSQMCTDIKPVQLQPLCAHGHALKPLLPARAREGAQEDFLPSCAAIGASKVVMCVAGGLHMYEVTQENLSQPKTFQESSFSMFHWVRCNAGAALCAHFTCLAHLACLIRLLDPS